LCDGGSELECPVHSEREQVIAGGKGVLVVTK